MIYTAALIGRISSPSFVDCSRTSFACGSVTTDHGSVLDFYDSKDGTVSRFDLPKYFLKITKVQMKFGRLCLQGVSTFVAEFTGLIISST